MNTPRDLKDADAYITKMRAIHETPRADKQDRQLMTFVYKEMQAAIENGTIRAWLDANTK